MKIVQSEFDDLFDIVRENIDRGWRDFEVDDAHRKIKIFIYCSRYRKKSVSKKP